MGTINVGLSIVVVSNGKILLGERNEAGELGQFGWNTPGGKLEEGETIVEGAIREVEEETGLKMKREDLKVIGIVESRITKHYVTFVFLAKLSKPKIPKPSEEVARWCWFGRKEIPEELYPSTRTALEIYDEFIKSENIVVRLM